MFEQVFKNIDDVLWKEAGSTTELDYTEQASWLLFLKYLDTLEHEKALEAQLEGKKYTHILDKPYRWESGASPKGKGGKLDHNTAMTGDDLRDFVKAHHHFNDPEWDGEPLAPEPKPESKPGPDKPDKPPVDDPDAVVRRKRIKVKLADGKERTIQHMMMTTFWHPDGTPMSAQQFMEMLFGKLPDFFQNEEELRSLWSAPDTRAQLLQGLAEKGFGHDQLAEMQKIIDAEKSDLFDVLAHVAYALPPLTREVRAANAKVYINSKFTTKQRAFLDFVLSHYVSVGVEELDQSKLTPLLWLKYHNSINDAIADLGNPDDIGKAFTGFQKYLYQQAA